MDYRLYAILTVLEAEKIDFTQVKETSIVTIRKSLNGLLTFVEFDCDNIAEFLQPLQVIKVVTYDELIDILNSNEWVNSTI
jgi:hypothetical protein